MGAAPAQKQKQAPSLGDFNIPQFYKIGDATKSIPTWPNINQPNVHWQVNTIPAISYCAADVVSTGNTSL